MTLRTVFSTLLAGVAAITLAAPAAAQTVTELGAHTDWYTFRYEEGGNPVCYMASKPTEERGDYSRRGDVFAMVTHRPAEGSRSVFSYIAGYTYQENSTVSATIDDEDRYELFTVDGNAFSRDEEIDDDLIASMRAGLDMEVVGTSTRGTVTTDTISLRGFTAAYNQITEACGL